MGKIILILSFLIICSCGSLRSYETDYIDPRTLPYIETYLYYKQQYLKDSYFYYDINVSFGDLPGNQLGICRWDSDPDEKRHIIIDYNKWQYKTDIERTILILHEMGHCDLNIINHDSVGIMQPIILDANLFLKDESSYLKQLFYR